MSKNIAVHDNMIQLIEKVSVIFEKEFGFKPNIIDVTKLICQRVEENNLFK